MTIKREFIFIIKDIFNETSEYNYLANNINNLNNEELLLLKVRSEIQNNLIAVEEKAACKGDLKMILFKSHLNIFLRNSKLKHEVIRIDDKFINRLYIVVNSNSDKKQVSYNYFNRYKRTFIEQVESLYLFLENNEFIDKLLKIYFSENNKTISLIFKKYFKQLKLNKSSLKTTKHKIDFFKEYLN